MTFFDRLIFLRQSYWSWGSNFLWNSLICLSGGNSLKLINGTEIFCKTIVRAKVPLQKLGGVGVGVGVGGTESGRNFYEIEQLYRCTLAVPLIVRSL